MKNELFFVSKKRGAIATGCSSTSSLSECKRLGGMAEKMLKRLDDGEIYLKPSQVLTPAARKWLKKLNGALYKKRNPQQEKIVLCARNRGKSIVYEAYSVDKMKIVNVGFGIKTRQRK